MKEDYYFLFFFLQRKRMPKEDVTRVGLYCLQLINFHKTFVYSLTFESFKHVLIYLKRTNFRVYLFLGVEKKLHFACFNFACFNFANCHIFADHEKEI